MPLPSSYLALAICAGTLVEPAVPSDASPLRTAAPARVAVLPLGPADGGPAPEAASALQVVRASLRQHGAEVLGREEVRVRLGLVETSLTELERAYAGAQAAYQADELDSAVRILGSVIEELERLPPGDASYALWVRAHLRVAVAERARGRVEEARRAMLRILALAPSYVVDADQFAPGFRRDFEDARDSLARAPRRLLRVEVRGPAVTVRVDGKEVGRAPLALSLPAGRYRVTGSLAEAAGSGSGSPVPPATVELAGEDVAVVLDASLREALRPESGPGVAVAPAERDDAAVAMGAWLRVDRVVALRLVRDGERRAIEASLHDVGRGARVREAQVPLVDGQVAPESARLLAAFLLAGERPARVPDLGAVTIAAPAARPARWLRPAACAAAVAALGAGTFAVLQARASQDRWASAAAMVRADGALAAGTDRAGYDAAVAGVGTARRNAWIGAAGAAALGLAAGVLGYLSLEARAPALGPAIRF